MPTPASVAENHTSLPTFTGELTKYRLSQQDGSDGRSYARLNFSVTVYYPVRRYNRSSKTYEEDWYSKSYPGVLFGQKAEDAHQQIEQAGGAGCLVTLSAIFQNGKPFEDQDKKTTVNFVELYQVQIVDIQPAVADETNEPDGGFDDFFL